MTPNEDQWKVATSVEEVRSTFSTQKISHNWLNGLDRPTLGQHHDRSPNRWIGTSLFEKALKGGEPLRLASWNGNLGVPARALVESISAIFGVRLVQVEETGNGNGCFIFSSEEMMLQLNISEMGRYLNVDVATSNAEIIAKSTKLFDRVIVPDNPDAGLIFTLAKGMGGYSLQRLGAAGTELERGNYNPNVLSAFDHIVQDLSSPSPCGRLVILAGQPGTGKTWLTRSLLSQARQAAFIVIPSHMVADMSGPEILPALTSAKREFPGPIVLIIEDADKVLVNRNQGDMSAISTMLNLGDGILGAVLDIRILATTNAEKLEMDPATRRPGRLCRYIQVDPLAPQVASSVYNRLTKTARTYKDPTSLAQVYLHARDAGWVAPPIADARPKMRMDILEKAPALTR